MYVCNYPSLDTFHGASKGFARQGGTTTVVGSNIVMLVQDERLSIVFRSLVGFSALSTMCVRMGMEMF